MTPEDIKTVGFKDMDPMQLEAFVKVIGHAIILSELTEDEDVAAEVLEDANELVRLFGGNSVSVQRNVDLQI